MTLKKIAVGISLTGLLVGIVSLFLPPLGVIDTSVLTFLGWVALIVGILLGWDALDKGRDAKIEHNGMTVTVTGSKDKE